MSATSPAWYQPPHGDDEAAWVDWVNRLPLVYDLGMRCLSIDDESGEFQLDESPLQVNPNGSVNGGLVAALIDQVLGALSIRHVPAGSIVNTANLDVRFLRPSLAPLQFSGSIAKAGRALIFVDVEVTDSTGRVCCTAAGTMMVVPVQR